MLKKDLILREQCLNRVKPFMDVRMVKILAGVRRSGKSYLLDMIGDELLSRGVKKDHIIYRLYTSAEVEDGFSLKEMFQELKSKIKDDNKYYFLLDEVQEVEGWEKAVNTLFEESDCDIYVTGSNSKLTAENISSYLSGRYILIPVYTLSFAEYVKFSRSENKPMEDVYRSYLRTGGFPLIVMSDLSEQQNYQIIDGIYHSIINKDVLKNHPVKEMEKFDRVVRFIMENTGKTFSANSISQYLKSQHRQISVESVYNYLKWLQDAFIIYKCERYDLQGKEVLKTQEKYYLSDFSLRYGLYSYQRSMDDSIMENIIYLELKRRGYDVFVGKNSDKEIDFVAKKQSEEIHIQATVRLPDNSDREIANLSAIHDFSHKYVVTADKNDVQVIDGIKVVYICDFLMMENW